MEQFLTNRITFFTEGILLVFALLSFFFLPGYTTASVVGLTISGLALPASVYLHTTRLLPILRMRLRYQRRNAFKKTNRNLGNTKNRSGKPLDQYRLNWYYVWRLQNPTETTIHPIDFYCTRTLKKLIGMVLRAEDYEPMAQGEEREIELVFSWPQLIPSGDANRLFKLYVGEKLPPQMQHLDLMI